jgi:Flp pilus assembly pilin Flp
MSKKAQASVEYVVMLVMVIIAVIAVGIAIKTRVDKLIKQKITTYFQKRLFNDRAMHTFPLRGGRK